MIRHSSRMARLMSRTCAPRRVYSDLPYNKMLRQVPIVNMLGVPVKDGQPKGGVEQGPHVLREGGVARKIQELGWAVNDLGDIKVEHLDDKVKASKSKIPGKIHRTSSVLIGNACELAAKEVHKSAELGNFHLTLGGDHSVAIGSVAGALMARPDVGVVWVDAHADINTPSSSESGNIHGMSVAFLMGLENCRNVDGFEWMENVPKLKPDKIVYIGLRDVDAGEKQFIKELNIKAFTMQDVDHYGIGRVMDMALDHISGRVERPIHMSFDIDSIDPFYAPSTGTTVRGGLTYREAFYLAESVADTGHLVSMDMVEVNPLLSASKEDIDTTVGLAVNIVQATLGDKIL